jgi:hypothetical protein
VRRQERGWWESHSALGFKIKYRTVERGHPRKIVLVPVLLPDAPPTHAPVNGADNALLVALDAERDAPPSVH